MKRIVFILMLLIPAAGYSQGIYNYIKTNAINSRSGDTIGVLKRFEYSLGIDTSQFGRNTLVPAGWVLDRLGSGGLSFPLSLDNGYFQLKQAEGTVFFEWSKAGIKMGASSENFWELTGTGITYYVPPRYSSDWSSSYTDRTIPDWGNVNNAIEAAVSGAVVTETDPVFSAHPAFGITSGKISTWDGLISFPGFGTTGTTAAYGNHNHAGVYQPVGSYLTENQTITLSGEVTGSGTTSITATLANSGVTAGSYKTVTVSAKGIVTAGSNPTTLSGFGITDAQPLDADLTSIAGLTGTRGLLQKSATNTFTLIGTITDSLNLYKFTRHPDVPQSYSGAANKVVAVNSSATGLQFSNVVTTNNVDTAELFWVYKNLNCKNLQSVQLSYSTNFTTFMPYQVKIAITSYDATAGTVDPVITIGNNATDYNNVLTSYTLSSPAAGKIYTVDLSQLINNLDSAPVFIKVGTASNKTTFTVAVILNGIYL